MQHIVCGGAKQQGKTVAAMAANYDKVAVLILAS